MPDAAARRQAGRREVARRVVPWLTWWVVLMVIWTMVDDSIGRDELIIGAGAAAIAAFLAELAAWQAVVRFRLRAQWLIPALALPGRVVRDTVTVTAALARQVLRGEEPPSCFVAEPRRFGGQDPEASTRRALLIAAESLAPNAFALGLDDERGVLISHKLVPGRHEAATWPDS